MPTPRKEELITGQWYWIYREPEDCTLMAQWVINTFVHSELKHFAYNQVENVEMVLPPDWKL